MYRISRDISCASASSTTSSNPSVLTALSSCLIKLETGSGDVNSSMMQKGYLFRNRSGNYLLDAKIAQVCPEMVNVFPKGSSTGGRPPPSIIPEKPALTEDNIALYRSVEGNTVHYYEGPSVAFDEYMQKLELDESVLKTLLGRPIVISSMPINFIYHGTPTSISNYLCSGNKIETMMASENENRDNWLTQMNQAVHDKNRLKKHALMEYCAKEVADGSRYIPFEFFVLTETGPVPFSQIVNGTNYVEDAMSKVRDVEDLKNWLSSLMSKNWHISEPKSRNVPADISMALPSFNVDVLLRDLTTTSSDVLSQICLERSINVILPKDATESHLKFQGYTKQSATIYNALSPKSDERVALEKSIAEANGVSTSREKPIVQMSGPPGTGKTLIAKNVQEQLGVPLILLDTQAVVSKWHGEAGRNLGFIFDMAEAFGDLYQRFYRNAGIGSLVFFDEIDTLVRDRTKGIGDHSHENQMVNIILKQLGKLNRNYGFLAATNCIEDLDEAYLSRVTERVALSLPSREDLVAIWKVHAHQLTQEELHTLADLCIFKPKTDITDEQLSLVGRDIKLAAASAEAAHIVNVHNAKSDEPCSSSPPLELYLYHTLKQREKWVRKRRVNEDPYWATEADYDRDDPLRVTAKLLLNGHIKRCAHGYGIITPEFAANDFTEDDLSSRHVPTYKPDDVVPFDEEDEVESMNNY
eukprot:GHVH01004542.1.p1 GENE.GHVH01004542.1~~GHVH01004542.1.p1  ORF type:complete len:698 (-),score=106.99 GHVH01004542.1:48-2141(-)